ncbi:MAG: hypothetical protein R3330_03450 [Saprospiraceae bacterium]|nr:hypothetical protein [Saprospiraceae bacterium]
MEEQRMDWGSMEETKFKPTDWLFFTVSFVALILLLLYYDRFFWVALPFAGTYLVKALRQM